MEQEQGWNMDQERIKIKDETWIKKKHQEQDQEQG